MWYDIKDNYVIFNIKALPNSSKNIICEIFDDMLKVKLKAPAVDNAANKELIKFFSKEFKTAKSNIKLIAGYTGKKKRLKLPLNDKIADFIQMHIKL